MFTRFQVEIANVLSELMKKYYFFLYPNYMFEAFQNESFLDKCTFIIVVDFKVVMYYAYLFIFGINILVFLIKIFVNLYN